jgi:hypothetical protein
MVAVVVVRFWGTMPDKIGGVLSPGVVIVKEAAATALGLKPDLKAWALTVALAPRVKGAV